MLHSDDCAALLVQVSRFGERTLAPLVRFAEHKPEKNALRAALAQAIEMGILPAPGQPGFALWELADEVDGFRLHLEVLMVLARYSASVAFDMHLSALAQRVLAGNGAYENVSIVLDGRGGLARYSLARYLAGVTLDAEDESILAHYFPGSGTEPFYVTAILADFFLVPAWQGEGILVWRLYAKESLELREIVAHGLDEIDHYRAVLKPCEIPLAEIVSTASECSRFQHIFALHSAGLMAIQTGIALAASVRAREYAAIRSQGGCLIREHAAVQQLLITSRAGGELGRALCASLPVPQDLAALCNIMEKRAALQEQFHSSVTDALQIFGGYGYMQDYGVEKLLRDQNHLAQLGGTATNARLFLAAVENHSAGVGIC